MHIITIVIALAVLRYSIKIHDLSELKEVYSIIDVEEEKGTCTYECTAMDVHTRPLHVYMYYVCKLHT